MVKIGEVDTGIVEDITLRHTLIRTFENRRVVIPNSTLSSATILNSTIADKKVCQFVEIGISYDSDLELATKIIEEEASKHPDFIDNRTNAEKEEGKPIVDVRVIDFRDSAVQLRAYVWSVDPLKAFFMRTDILKAVKLRFDAEGVIIPYPHRTLYVKEMPGTNPGGEESLQ